MFQSHLNGISSIITVVTVVCSLSSITLSQRISHLHFLKAPPYTALPPSLGTPSFTLCLLYLLLVVSVPPQRRWQQHHYYSSFLRIARCARNIK